MIHPNHRRIVLEMLSLPTAPFVEGAVVSYLERFCESRPSLKLTRDRAGNLLVHLRRGRRRVKRPICLTAHLDHPGFIADRMRGTNKLRALWRGGVQPPYFVGSRVRFHAEGRWTRGTVRSIETYRDNNIRRVSSAMIDVARPIPAGAPGMWDFPDASIAGGRIKARGCDDLAGAAAMVCCLEEMVRRRMDGDAYFLFTRAEEVGFVGALAACRLNTVPTNSLVVVVETSSQLPFARIGDGPVLRVGDKATVFTPAVTAHCGAVAADLAKRDRGFAYQRKLMDGGTCEASAYGQLGYDATCLCLSLGNYHNMNTRTKRLGAEYVSLRDYVNLVKWFVELSRGRQPYAAVDRNLVARLGKIEKQYKQVLSATRRTPVY